MKRAALLSLFVLCVFVTTIVVVRFVPGAGKIFGATQYDTYADGRCEVTENVVVRSSYAILGRPGPRPTLVKVVVSDLRGPIAGARVSARSIVTGARSSPSATTGPGGEAALEFSEDFTVKEARLDVEAPGFSAFHEKVSFGDAPVDVKLVAKRMLRGVVVDEDGEPVRAAINANGCGNPFTVDGAFEVECQANFEVGITGRRGDREEGALRIDVVTVKPPVDASTVKVIARRKGAKARIFFPHGDAPGSNVMLTQQEGRDAPVVYAAWQQGEIFGFVALEPGHWWVYSHRVDEPNGDLHRTEFTVTADGENELFLLPASPVFKFPQ